MGLFRTFFVFIAVGIASAGFGRGENAAVPLFEASTNAVRGAGLTLNDEALQRLRSDAASVQLGAIPMITGETASFELKPLPVFAPNADIQLMNAGGTTTSLAAPDIKTWMGTNPEHPDRAMFVSAAANGDVQVMISGDAQTSVTVISRDKGHAFGNYRVERAALPARDFCAMDTLPQEARAAATPETLEGRAGNNNIVYEIDMLIDVGNYLFTNNLNGDTAATLDYLTNLFGAVNTVYRRDLKVHFSLKHVVIWGDMDPISGPPSDEPKDTMDQINQYQVYVYNKHFNRDFDLAHFLDGYPIGGRAYLSALESYRRQFRIGVSNVDAFGSFPTDGSYYWDTMVVAHELGHNLGSQHTHCFVPPIDCCEVERGCGGCTMEKPAFGTIMSYCHLQMFNGGGVDMRFHERCINLMRHLVETSLLVSPYKPQPDIEIRGSEGTLIPLNSLEARRSTLLRSTAVGVPVEQQYIINNTGSLGVELTGTPRVQLFKVPPPTGPFDQLEPLGSGTGFSVKSQPASNMVAAGASTNFTLEYRPVSAQDQWAVVQVTSNDPDEGLYRFLVKGRLFKPTNPYIGTNEGDVVIPEMGGRWTQVPVKVEDVPGVISEVAVRFNGTNCSIDSQTGIEHSYVGDLTILLESPSGTTMTLVKNAGATTDTEPGVPGKNFCNTLLRDEPGAPSIQTITAEEAPYSGTYAAMDSFWVFTGEQPNGTWKFWFYDRAQPDQGTVHSISVLIRGDMLSSLEVGPPLTSGAENWSLYK